MDLRPPSGFNWQQGQFALEKANMANGTSSWGNPQSFPDKWSSYRNSSSNFKRNEEDSMTEIASIITSVLSNPIVIPHEIAEKSLAFVRSFHTINFYT